MNKSRGGVPCVTDCVVCFCLSHLENSSLTLSSSLTLCRFLRAGYRDDTASRLPLRSSSTSAPLKKCIRVIKEIKLLYQRVKLHILSTAPGLFQSFIKYGELLIPECLQGTKHRFVKARIGFLTPAPARHWRKK